MKIAKKQFLDNIVGFEILKGNKYAVYYDPFKNKKKGGSTFIDTARKRGTPYIIAFLGGITTRFLYDVSKLVNKSMNEKDKKKTNYKIFKEFIQEEYGSSSNAFRRFIVDPLWQAAIGGYSYQTIKDNLKDDKWLTKNLNILERAISGEKKPGPKPKQLQTIKTSYLDTIKGLLGFPLDKSIQVTETADIGIQNPEEPPRTLTDYIQFETPFDEDEEELYTNLSAPTTRPPSNEAFVQATQQNTENLETLPELTKEYLTPAKKRYIRRRTTTNALLPAKRGPGRPLGSLNKPKT